MQVSKNKALVIKEALSHWQAQQLLSPDQVKALKKTIHITPFDWRRLARYSFWFSVACLLIAVSAVLMDQVIMDMIALYFKAPALAKTISFTLLAALLYGGGYLGRKRSPDHVFRNEALFFLGVMATAAALSYGSELTSMSQDNISMLFLISCLIYGALGLYLSSPLIWVFSLLSLGSWLGAQTGYMSGWGAYYLGMNYPMRFTLLGGVLLGGAWVCLEIKPLRPFHQSTLVMGLLYLFVALWILSIFGNYGDMDSWLAVKQSNLFLWSLLFGLAALLAIGHGLAYHNTTTRGFGLVFLIINLYTRFFEYFWAPLHKALFFALLGVSFWFLGSYAERLWSVPGRLLKSPKKGH